MTFETFDQSDENVDFFLKISEHFDFFLTIFTIFLPLSIFSP